MKRAIVFSTLLAVAAGFFALGDAQRDAYRTERLAAASVAQQSLTVVLADNAYVEASNDDANRNVRD